MSLRIRLARAFLIISAACLAPASPASAEFLFAVQSVSDAQGSTNDTLQVTLTNTGPSAATIGGFAFEIKAGTGVTFTAVDTGTSTPYIFLNHSGFGPDISNQPPTLPGNVLDAEDFYDIGGSGISLASGATVGLGDVHFNVASNATGSIAITLTGFPTTNLSNASGADITATGGGPGFTNGTVTVTPLTTPSPEPSTLAMAAAGLAAGVCHWLRRRRAA